MEKENKEKHEEVEGTVTPEKEESTSFTMQYGDEGDSMEYLHCTTWHTKTKYDEDYNLKEYVEEENEETHRAVTPARSRLECQLSTFHLI